MIDARARAVASRMLKRTDSSMKLENQAVSDVENESQLDEARADALKSRLPSFSSGTTFELGRRTRRRDAALTPDDRAQLKPRWVTTRADLNSVEQANILNAQIWLAARRNKDALSETFLRSLHKRMFGDVWTWAGEFHRSNTNIGVDWYRVQVELRELLGNARAWCEHRNYGWDELGARFHHKLVAIHCFPNGNGRHARLATDALLKQHSQQLFSWGALAMSTSSSETRKRYISALKLADREDYGSVELRSCVRDQLNRQSLMLQLI